MVVPQAAESWNVLIFSQDCDGATTASKKGFICSRELKGKQMVLHLARLTK